MREAASLRFRASETTSMLTRLSLQASILQHAMSTSKSDSPQPEKVRLAELQLFPEAPADLNFERTSSVRASQSMDLDMPALAIRKLVHDRRLNVSSPQSHMTLLDFHLARLVQVCPCMRHRASCKPQTLNILYHVTCLQKR